MILYGFYIVVKIENMIFDVNSALSKYKPKPYLDIQKDIQKVERVTCLFDFIFFILMVIVTFSFINFMTTIYLFIIDRSNSQAILVAGIYTLLPFIVAIILLNKPNYFARKYFKKNYPYMDSSLIILCSKVVDLDKLIFKDISLDQLDKLNFIAEKNEMFKDKINEVKEFRNGVFTKFDYYIMNCEKIYAILKNDNGQSK